jgi:hypothetical protein
MADQHCPLPAEALDLAKLEAAMGQHALDVAGAAVGRESCALARDPCQRLEDGGRPQFGVFRWREAVQVERVGAQAQGRQAVLGVAENQCEDHASVLELQPMRAGDEHRPLICKCLRERCYCRIADGRGVGPAQIGERERMFFGGNEMESLATRRICTPGGPGHQEVDAHAKTGFQHGENALPLPAFRQRISAQKYMVGLLQTADGTVIDIVVEGRKGRAVVSEREDGGD